MRFHLVDRLTRLELGESVEGFKCWSMADDVFQDHFPGRPVVPGVLLVESMAQMMGFLLQWSYHAKFGREREPHAILSIIHKAKFRRTVIPGDRVDMVGRIISMDTKRASCTVRGTVDGETRVDADLSFVWYVVDRGELPPELLMQRESYERNVLVGLPSEVDLLQ